MALFEQPLVSALTAHHPPSPPPRPNLTPDTSSPLSVSSSDAPPTPPFPPPQSSIDGLGETTRDWVARERSEDHPGAALAPEQTEHPELYRTSLCSHSGDGAEPAARRDRHVATEQAAGQQQEVGHGTRGSQVRLEGPAGLCRYEYENYKHMIHVGWADRYMRASRGQGQSSS